MAGRTKLRIGRRCRYFPTASEVSSGGGGAFWLSVITKVNQDGTVSLDAFCGGSSVTLAKTAIPQSGKAGGFDLRLAS